MPETRQILIVDDDEFLRKLLQMNLKQKLKNCSVLMAESGETGIMKLEEKGIHVDLILVDLIMTGMNGFQFISRVRENPKFKNTPILVMTARSCNEDVNEAMALGAKDVLIKPFVPEELIRRIEQWLCLDKPE
ncbi:MAG: response regulator [Candidatus Aureabacteria bacterium]|nr:response regulator [Candidatus Auribacterota bacterium]